MLTKDYTPKDLKDIEKEIDIDLSKLKKTELLTWTHKIKAALLLYNTKHERLSKRL